MLAWLGLASPVLRRYGGKTDRKALEPGVLPLEFGMTGGNLSPLGDTFPRLLGPTDSCLLPFLLMGGFNLWIDIVMVTGGSGNCFIFCIIFCRFFSYLSHLVTSKEAFAFYRRSSCLKFSIISSLSLRRFLSLFKLLIDLECGLILIADLVARCFDYPADIVDRSDLALPDRFFLGRFWELKALPSLWESGSLGAKLACVATHLQS